MCGMSLRREAAMLKIQDITVTYGKKTKSVLRHFSLDVQPGEICSLVGESGSGKTTVVRAVHGTLPEGGKVLEGSIHNPQLPCSPKCGNRRENEPQVVAHWPGQWLWFHLCC